MFVDWFKVGLISGLLFIFTLSTSQASAPATREALIQLNTAPMGVVDVAGASAAPAAAKPLSGVERYKTTCSVCHDIGAAGAPKIGNKAAWSARLAKGEAALVSSVINGLGAMPARGGCASCSDDEIKAAVEYLIQNSR